MFRPVADDVSTADVSFEIDPMRAPFFSVQQLQADTGEWREVGYVWTFGTSRTNSQEFWFLFDSVQEGDRGRAAYNWPGAETRTAEGAIGIKGADLRLVPGTAPQGTGPSNLAAYLQRTYGVTLTSLRATVGAYSP
ncbi:MAG: hypothetical protein QM820_34735 [Minicystis sp.]